MAPLERFIATFDLHYGSERRGGHTIALHDPKAWAAVMAFAADFKPTTWIMGGDILDCACISHHNKKKPGRVEGMRLAEDAAGCRRDVIEPAEKLVAAGGSLVYLVGNHEDWLTDLTDEVPALEGIVDIRSVLKLSKRWHIIPQGGFHNLGKLTFIHGDQLKGGDAVAKAAVIAYERNIRFGHFHTHQVYAKTSAISYKNVKTGVAVPCLCRKDPAYGEQAPNRWCQGFLYGYIHPDGMFNDYVVTIINGTCAVNGRLYKG